MSSYSEREKRRKRYNSNSKSSFSNEGIGYLLPLMFVVIILPLIVKMHDYSVHLENFDWFSFAGTAKDIFLFYKQWYFVVAVAIMACVVIYQGIMNKKIFRWIPMLIPLGIYVLLSVLSTIVSKYSDFGYTGIFEQFENVFCLIGYGVIVYYMFLQVKSEKTVRILINALAIGALCIGLIGMFQTLHLDLFRSNFGKWLMASKGYDYKKLQVTFEIGRAYATLYNPNYLGVYAAFIIPVFILLIPFGKALWEKILYGVVAISLLISLYGSGSTAGMMALGVAAIVTIFMLRKKLINHWKVTVPVIVGLIVLVVAGNVVSGQFSADHKTYLAKMMDKFNTAKAEPPILSEIVTGKEDVTFVYNQTKVKMQIILPDDGQKYASFAIYDKDGKPMKTTFDENGVGHFEDEKLANVTFYYKITTMYETLTETKEVDGFGLMIDGKEWFFTNQTKDGSYKYYNYYGKLASIEKGKSAIFDGYEGLATKRGFIWSRTIPLLKDYILLGSGADTFAIAFQQHDYVGFYNFGYENQVITKPHCWYLQVSVQTGMLSLIALLVFYGMYLVEAVRVYSKRNFDSFLSCVGIALFVGTTSYMVCGLTNDSMVTVAPVFWFIIGLGIAVNQLVKKEKK